MHTEIYIYIYIYIYIKVIRHLSFSFSDQYVLQGRLTFFEFRFYLPITIPSDVIIAQTPTE